MRIFKNRSQAGDLLIPLLKQYLKHPHTVVIGLPRGGVVTAFAIAQGLHLPLDVLCLRKIGAPHNPELAIGAVSACGESFLNEDLIEQLDVSKDYIASLMEKERLKAQERLLLYRKNQPKIDFEDKTIILVDDGLATGATMHAAIKTAQARGAARIVVAVPVSSSDTAEEIKEEVDELICLEIPFFFEAVGQFYQDFSQTDDDEVIELLQQAQTVKKNGEESSTKGG